jgi:hypothetical protein
MAESSTSVHVLHNLMTTASACVQGQPQSVPDVGAPAPADHMTFLCELCEKLLAQMTTLTDRFEEEKQKNTALSDELELTRQAHREACKTQQRLENQLQKEVTQLQKANEGIYMNEHTRQLKIAEIEEERKELIYNLETRHQKEIAELKVKHAEDLAIIKSIQMNQHLLQPYLQRSCAGFASSAPKALERQRPPRAPSHHLHSSKYKGYSEIPNENHLPEPNTRPRSASHARRDRSPRVTSETVLLPQRYQLDQEHPLSHNLNRSTNGILYPETELRSEMVHGHGRPKVETVGNYAKQSISSRHGT